MTALASRKHTRIFLLTPAHTDELLRRKIARDDATRTTANQGSPRYAR